MEQFKKVAYRNADYITSGKHSSELFSDYAIGKQINLFGQKNTNMPNNKYNNH